MLKSWPLGVRWGHKWENWFYMCLYSKNIIIKILFPKNQLARIPLNFMKAILHSAKARLLKIIMKVIVPGVRVWGTIRDNVNILKTLTKFLK